MYSFTNVEILEFINRATLGDECSKVGGWYDHQSIDGMRNLVLKLIAARFEAFFSNPLTIEGEEFAPHAESTDAFEKAGKSNVSAFFYAIHF